MMKTKKMLTVLSLSALLAGTGATVLQNYPQASAATKKHTSTKKVKKVKKAKHKKEKLNSDGTDSQSKYPNFGTWFYHNSKIIDNYYNWVSNAYSIYREAQQDAHDANMHTKYFNNPSYKYGYIMALGNDESMPSYSGGAGTAAQYQKMYEVYQNAKSLIDQGNPDSDINLDTINLTWSVGQPDNN